MCQVSRRLLGARRVRQFSWRSFLAMFWVLLYISHIILWCVQDCPELNQYSEVEGKKKSFLFATSLVCPALLLRCFLN